MRTTTKYEEIVYEFIHHNANKDFWPYPDLMSFVNHRSSEEPLTGKEFLFVWQRDEKVFVEECSSIDDFLNIPNDAIQFSKHEIEMEWYEQNRTLVEC